MGSGEVTPNGSIYWSLVHDVKKPWAGVPARVKGEKQEVSYENGGLHGVDAVPGNSPAFLHATLRFGSQSEAQNALRAAVTQDPNTQLWAVNFTIRAIHRSQGDAELAPPNPYAQIVFSWDDEGGGGQAV